MIKQILLWNKTYVATNPREGLLFRLTAAHRDACDTMDETFREMDALLTKEALYSTWGTQVRNHMAQLRKMFAMYSHKQKMVCFVS